MNRIMVYITDGEKNKKKSTAKNIYLRAYKNLEKLFVLTNDL